MQVEGGAHFYDQLHYHPEFQITAIEQGSGIFYAGNSMTAFAPGTVLMIGSGVHHLLKNASVFYTNNSPGIKGVSLFFDQHSFGHRFFEIEEMAGVKGVLQASLADGVLSEGDRISYFILRNKISVRDFVVLSYLCR